MADLSQGLLFFFATIGSFIGIVLFYRILTFLDERNFSAEKKARDEGQRIHH